jgi:cell shape-determining protein MreC
VKRREGRFLLVGIVILAALIFLAPSYGWKVRTWLGPRATQQADTPDLAAENQTLKAELAQLQKTTAQTPRAPLEYLRAMVYSRYPMSFRNEILVNLGVNDGAVIGKAVVFQGILVGRIEKTFSDSALAQTVFDASFKMPVRVGAGGYDALLVGGASPKITSMAKTAPVHTGDIVYAAAEGLPYGLPVALVAGTSTSPDNLFEEAALSFAYDMNGVQSVLVAK